MDTLTGMKQGLEHTLSSLGEGWRHLRQRTSDALTHFTPSSKSRLLSEPLDTGEFPSTNWALLAGDLFEDHDKFVVRLEVPGLDKQNLNIEVHNDVLVVHGEKRYEQESSQGQYRLRQCAFGSFQRSIPLTAPVLSDKATASYRNGVLRIELPKAEHRNSRRIEVRGE